jgi:hypothetical protein
MAEYPELILFVEKDACYEVIEDLAWLFGCSSYSGHVQSGLSAVEVLIEQIFDQAEERQSRPAEPPEELTVLAMVDYDWSGHIIYGGFLKQLRNRLDHMGHRDCGITPRIIGIRPDQLTPERIEQAKIPLPPGKSKTSRTKAERWLEQTGGIDEELKGLEIQGLSKQEIRSIYIDHIME